MLVLSILFTAVILLLGFALGKDTGVNTVFARKNGVTFEKNNPINQDKGELPSSKAA